MRTLLEFLGFVEPQGSRREPVALPAWARAFMPALVVVLTVLSLLVFAAVRALIA